MKEPQLERSRRTLPLPPSLVTALRAHRDRQAFDQVAVGKRWEETSPVLTTTIGTPLDARNVRRSWHRVQTRLTGQQIEAVYCAAHAILAEAPLC